MCGSPAITPVYGSSCVQIQSFQKEDPVAWFDDVTEKDKSDLQVVVDFYSSTTVNLATTPRFLSKMSSLESFELLDSSINCSMQLV